MLMHAFLALCYTRTDEWGMTGCLEKWARHKCVQSPVKGCDILA